MANASFGRSIGGAHGSGGISKSSVGISQSDGSPVNGNYYTNTQQPAGAGKPPARVDGKPNK
jgi:hypothetical protein